MKWKAPLFLLFFGLVTDGQAAPAPPAARRTIKSKEHLAERASIPLVLYEKWATGEEAKWRQNGKVVLLVHGATWASRCTFDPLPGYSLMDDLADAGFDVFALDLHGYGGSGKTDKDSTDAAAAIADLDVAADYIRALRWVERVDVVGYQWGAQVAGLFAERHPNKVARLALLGMRYQLHEQAAAPRTPVRTLAANAAMLMPGEGDFDPAIVRRRSEVCMKQGREVPTGALKDVGRPSPVAPEKLGVPTLLLQGEREGDAQALADRTEFFKTLAAHDKRFVVVPGVGKHALLERGHARVDRALLDFLAAE
jgi:alpha-beta hydrolase superfamily lysophospholipase